MATTWRKLSFQSRAELLLCNGRANLLDKFQIARSRANGSANQLPSDSRFAARPSTSSELSMGYGQYLNYSQYINTGGYSEYSNYGEYSNSAA